VIEGLHVLLDLVPNFLLLSQLELESPLLHDGSLCAHLVIHQVPSDLLLELPERVQLLLEAVPLLLGVHKELHEVAKLSLHGEFHGILSLDLEHQSVHLGNDTVNILSLDHLVYHLKVGIDFLFHLDVNSLMNLLEETFHLVTQVTLGKVGSHRLNLLDHAWHIQWGAILYEYVVTLVLGLLQFILKLF
jgi:hypothetical protein